ncbi:MAG: DUF58 domain-containing protein [Gammaproteobacteria bacterium]|nr:DUF58 domain-containing protein [Gammaproteobacteria bacterium]
MAQQMDLTEQLRPLLLWFSRRFNPQRFFIVLTLVLFLVAWNRGIALLYGMVSLLIALLAVSYLLPGLNIRKLQVKLPTHLQCHAGQMLTLPLQLFSRTPCQHISINTDHRFPADDASQAAFAPYVDGEANVDLRLVCKQRGDYSIDQLTASSDFPFGIHTAQRTIDCSRCRVLVYPRTFRISQLPGFNSRSSSFHGQRIINLPHADEEYAGAREYRHGDSLKHIHWGASAKHQELVVREFESYDQPAMLIILNCNADDDHGSAPDSCFEYSVEIAASLMLFASHQGIAVELIAESASGFHLSLAPGENVSEYHLGQFAQMKADGDRDYVQQVISVCSRFHPIDSIVTFLPQHTLGTHWLDTKNHVDIRFDEASFINRSMAPSAAKASRSGTRVTYTVPWGHPLEHLFDASQ